MKKVLFSLRCDFPSGGCIKMRDYYNHVKHSPLHTPAVYLPPDNAANLAADNPWYGERNEIEPQYRPEQADVLFISGLGWDRFIPPEYRQNSPIPIIYLAQSMFKAFDPPYRDQFAYKAIRISVSPDLTEAITRQKTIINGPLFTIPSCVDRASFPQPLGEREKSTDILILGIKQAELAAKLRASLAQSSSIKVINLSTRVAQRDFLAEINRAKLVICLPAEQEGFYLPALEAMALGALVICPQVGGNRHYCQHQLNCLTPDYNFEAIVEQAIHALTLPVETKRQIIAAARATAGQHAIEQERQAFLDILHRVHAIW